MRRFFDITALFVLAALSTFIAAGRDLSFDQSFTQWLQGLGRERPLLDNFMSAVTHLGDTLTIFLATLVFAILLNKLSGRRRPAFAMLITLGLGYTLNNGLKFLFERPRPQFSTAIIDPTSYSFPSGHAMISLAIYGCAAFLFSDIYPKRKWVFVIVAATVTFFIGISRVYLDAHWPSDILAGYAAGWIIVSAVAHWYLNQPAPK